MSAFLVSFGVIFVAELGDKSQLLALALATRIKPWPVLIGILLGTAVVHLVSVGLGAGFGAALPHRAVQIGSGIAFLGFAAWTLRGDEAPEEATPRTGRALVVSIAIAFGLAELGDKTMLATVTLATDHGVVGTWAGSTVGMVAADALAIIVGTKLGARLPERAVRVGAALLFVAFGVALLAGFSL